MELHRNNKLYLSIIIFMIPPIVLSAIILSARIKASNLENIISSPEPILSECYNLTYSFINEQNSDKNYISLHSYLKSFLPLCIVIIIAYVIKIFFSIYFASILEEEMVDGANGMYLIYIDAPARILSFIPLIVCVIILIVRSFTINSEVFMNYYNLCSDYYGDSFRNSFSSIMNIRIYTLLVVILFVWETIYHAIIAKKILDQ